MATTATASFPLSPRASPPPPASLSGPATASSSSSSPRRSPFVIREIPPFRPKQAVPQQQQQQQHCQLQQSQSSHSQHAQHEGSTQSHLSHSQQSSLTGTTASTVPTSTTSSTLSHAAQGSAFLPQPTVQHPHGSQSHHRSGSSAARERRSSHASGASSSSSSRRNSGYYNAGNSNGVALLAGSRAAPYPSPAPSSPAHSPTHVHAQFFPSSSTLPSGISSLTTSTGQPALAQAYDRPALNTASTSSSAYVDQQHQYAQVPQPPYGGLSSSMTSPGLAMLQGIEAQLQIPPFRGNSSTSTSSSRHSSRPSSSSRRDSSGIPLPVGPLGPALDTSSGPSRVTGPTHRIPATHQTQHRPASTTVVPIQPSLLASPPMQYPSASSSGGYLYPTNMATPDMRAQLLLSQSTRGGGGPVTSAQTTSAAAHHYQSQSQYAHYQQHGYAGSSSTGAATGRGNDRAANNRNRASHQIVPANAPPPVPTIALHTAQYANPNKPKVFFGDFQLLQTLGEGEFGKVKLAVHAQRWGEEVAIKLIKRNAVDNTTKSVKIQREIDILRLIKHPHIVRLADVVETDKYIGIVLEYVTGGELFEYILAHKHLKENIACRLFAQVISGVAYLHAKKIVHRDLKLENLLLDRNRNIIITDFGFANRFNERTGSDLMTTSCGSPCYAAPELVLQDGQYVGSAVDVWSCGVILYAMLSGYLPYDDDPSNPDGDNISLLYKYITSTKLSFPDWISPEPRNLLQMMLVPDPMRRCTLKDVMCHPWLSHYAPWFLKSIEELEQEADDLYEEKCRLLQRQQAAYYRRSALAASQNASGALSSSMARSATTPGEDSAAMTSQQRHRSAMVQPVSDMYQHRPSLPTPLAQHLEAGFAPSMDASMSASSSRSDTPQAMSHPEVAMRFNDPFAARSAVSTSVTPEASQFVIPPFSAPLLGPSGLEAFLPSSAAMTPAHSTPGEVEGISDSLTSEGDKRGEPRSRRNDEDDASTTSSTARGTRQGSSTGASNVSSPSKGSSNSSDTKKRKGEEKRHSAHVDLASPPPAESTRSKTRARDSLGGSQSGASTFASPVVKSSITPSSTMPNLPSFIGEGNRPYTGAENAKLPILEAASAADDLGVDMRSDSPPRPSSATMQDSDGPVAPATPPQQTSSQLATIPTVSPISENAEILAQKADEEARAAQATPRAQNRMQPRSHGTPPTSPTRQMQEAARKTPQRAPHQDSATEGASIQRTPRASAQHRQPEPAPSFPSPEREQPARARPVSMAATIEGDPSTRSRASNEPSNGTQSSQRSSQRHRKGLSTDKAFFSRLLGNSTTSVDRTGAVGEGSRSRTPSQEQGVTPVFEGSKTKADAVEASAPSDISDTQETGRRGAGRRKALSLVVDPFGRSSNHTGHAQERNNRRSVKAQTVSIAVQPAQAQKQGPRSSNIPMSPSMPMSPSLQAVHQPLRQVPAAAVSNTGPPSPYSTRSTESKVKRMSDWFRLSRVSRSSASGSHPGGIENTPEQKKPELGKSALTRSASTRQRQSSVIQQPSVVVHTASPQAQPQPQPQQRQPAPPRVVATPSDARTLSNNQATLMQSGKPTRHRHTPSDARKPVAFDDSRLKMHSGATDKRIVTKTLPPAILEEVRRVLYGMGIQVVPDSDFRLSCTRRSRKQIAALAANAVPTSGLSPSPSSTFRSFFSRKNSATGPTSTAMVSSASMPSPALTISSMMDSPESAALSPTLSSQSQMQVPTPYYGSSHDNGGEVRFTIEVVRVKHLSGLYTLDFRRLKGALPDYKENHETCIERLNLGAAL